MNITNRKSLREQLFCPQCSSPLTQDGDGYRCQPCGNLFPVIDGVPIFVGASTDRTSFRPELFEPLHKAEDRHFWFIGRREVIFDIMSRQIPDLSGKTMLEIGCGNGNVLQYLHQNTDIDLAGGDLFLEGLDHCRRKLGIPVYQVSITRLPFRDRFDIIGIFDVLEHIEDDKRALQECRNALKAQGRLILTVPACPQLWSSFDEFSSHKRRYTRRELVRKLTGAGFAIERVSHFMSTLLPAIFVFRFLKDRVRRLSGAGVERFPGELGVVPILNDLCLGTLRLERFLMRYVDLPWGASLLVLARRV